MTTHRPTNAGVRHDHDRITLISGATLAHAARHSHLRLPDRNLGFGARSGWAFSSRRCRRPRLGPRVFSFAIAMQNLLWGAGQPFAGGIADRFGPVPVLSVGAILYALGLAAMSYSSTPGMLDLSAGVLIGFGLAGCSFTVVIGAFGKLVPPKLALVRVRRRHRGRLVRPIPVFAARGCADRWFGWQTALLIFAGLMLLVMPLSLALATPEPAATGARGAGPAIGQAGADRSLRPPQLRAAGARLLHLRLPARFRHRPSAVLSDRPRASGRGRRLDHRPHRPVQHRRLARVGLAGQRACRSATSCRSSISPARWRSWSSSAAGDARPRR